MHGKPQTNFWSITTLKINSLTSYVDWSSPSSKAKASGWLQSAVTTTNITCCDAFSSSSVVSHGFSALFVYSKFGHHPHPLGYLCAKFCFFCSVHSWTSPRRKITYWFTHSLTHSPSLFVPQEPKLSLRNISLKFAAIITLTIELPLSKRHTTPECSFDLDLHPMTLTYMCGRCICILTMKSLGQDFEKLTEQTDR